MAAMQDDPLLALHASLLERVAAWKDAWTHRQEPGSAAVAQLVSINYLGRPISQQLETRLLEARREIEHQLARLAGALAAGVAITCRPVDHDESSRTGDTDAIERKVQDHLLHVGRHDEAFETKLAELAPLVELYRRVTQACHA